MHQHHFPVTNDQPWPRATRPWPSRAGRASTNPPRGVPEACPQTVPTGRPGKATCEPLVHRAVSAPVPISPGRQVVSTLTAPRLRASGQTAPYWSAKSGDHSWGQVELTKPGRPSCAGALVRPPHISMLEPTRSHSAGSSNSELTRKVNDS